MLRPSSIPVLVLLAAAALPAAAQSGGQPTSQSGGQSGGQTLKARCSQLIAYYDRFGAGRSNNSDGRRNHTRLSAEIDCSRGLYAEGIAEMEALLRRKKFTPPPPGPEVDEDYN